MALNDLPLRSITARSDFEPLTGVRAHAWPYNLAVTRAALAGLTFGQLTIIVGENGAGKSSLVESIAEAYGLPLGGGQVVLCTHSPLLAALAVHRNELIWEIGEWGIERSSWAELDMTSHWRHLLDDPEAYFRYL